MLQKIKPAAVLTALLLLTLLLTGCSARASKSAIFTVTNGDNIQVQVDLRAGYNLKMEVPFKIMKGEEVILNGTFAEAELYDTYYQLVLEDPDSMLLANEDDGDITYFYYKSANEDAAEGWEYDYFVKPADTKTVVIMGSLSSQEEAEAAFSAVTVRKAPPQTLGD